MKTRKVLITNGMSNDMMLIETNAPKQSIEKWCYDYNESLENGNNPYFDELQNQYYVEVLHDSELNNNNDNVDIIGYNEVYNLNDYYN